MESSQLRSVLTKEIFTIGHSNQSIESFLGLLSKHYIDVLVDTRSFPVSKFAPWFDQDRLNFSVKGINKQYLFLGKELGGKPKEPSFYDDQGYVLYWKIAESALFQQGIERVKNGIISYRIALLCSEENPLHCHRRLLVGRVLQTYGITINHIRGNGIIQTEHALEIIDGSHIHQMNIFSQEHKEKPWKSIQSVSLRNQLLSSSNP